jgi:hypothetical protein
MNLLGLALLLIVSPGDRPDLSGVVTSKAGVPLAGAHVLIYEAGVRQGSSPFCPSCYADCGKRSESDREGAFRVESLDPSLIFRVLVIADGYRPTFVSKVDPAKGPIRVTVEPMDLDKIPPDRIVRGLVLDEGGRPVAGASVRAYMFRTEEFSGYSPRIVDPLAITNLEGEFALTSRSPIRDLDLQVSARGLAPKHFPKRAPQSSPHRLAMGAGAEVTGRLTLDGKPLGGVSIGLVQANRGIDHFLGATEIGTDADGRFLFSNVAPNDDYYVYGIMTSLKDRGAVIARPVKVGALRTKADVGDLAVEPGHRIAGRVLTSDDKPIPPGTRILISREEAWDSLSAVLDAEGKFAIVGLPNEQISLSVAVKGYHLSSRNKSLDTNNPFQLKGFVDGDIDGLKILLEPGK